MHGLVDEGQKLLVYFGGNNITYFKEAFPAFLTLLGAGLNQADLSKLIIVLQQHPGAKKENLDGQALEKWVARYRKETFAPRVFLSTWGCEAMQVVANVALYYQTSMAAHFVLSGIPTLQVGHETYLDSLVRSGLCLARISHQTLGKLGTSAFPNIPSKSFGNVYEHSLQELLEISKKQPVQSSSRAGEKYGLAVTQVDEFLHVLDLLEKNPQEMKSKNMIFEGLGIREDWPHLLKAGLVASND